MNECDLNHGTHDVLQVPTVQGTFNVFDAPKYAVHPGSYCPGQDAISDRLIVEGFWEKDDSKPIAEILERGDRSKLVIDFGSHIGWYTIMAAELGYYVLAIDADAENLRLLQSNAVLHGVEDKITTRRAWVDEHFTLEGRSAVELVKVDLEGNDALAVDACWPFIDRVENLYVEISPVFNAGYPALVQKLRDAGFTAYWTDGRLFDDDYSLTQFNLRFSR
jgi:SAM-dependent methyltransferase